MVVYLIKDHIIQLHNQSNYFCYGDLSWWSVVLGKLGVAATVITRFLKKIIDFINLLVKYASKIVCYTYHPKKLINWYETEKNHNNQLVINRSFDYLKVINI